MNLGQRRRRVVVEKLIDIAHGHGLGSEELRDYVHKACVGDLHPDDPRFEDMWRRADRISRAGLMAQLYFLLDVHSEKVLTAWLMKKGNALDAFVKGFSSSPEAREKDVGRGNVNLDGCVMVD